MCPACFATAAWVFAGTTSAGGLTALVVNKFRGRNEAQGDEPHEPTRTDEHPAADKKPEPGDH